MKKLSVVFAVFIFTARIFFGFAAAADDGLSGELKYNPSDGKITVFGLCSIADTKVTFTAVSEGSDADTELSAGKAVYFGQTESDLSKKYSRVFKLSGSLDTGIYDLHIKANGEEIILKFRHASENDILEALAKVNSATAAALSGVIEQNALDLTLNLDDFINKNQISSLIFAQKPFANLKAFHEAYSKAVLTAQITNSENPYKLLEKYGALAGINSDMLKALNADSYSYALSLIKNNSYASFGEFSGFYNDSVILGVISKAANYSDIKTAMLTTYASYLNLDLSVYNKILRNTDQVFKNMMNIDYTSIAQLKQKFYDCAKSVYDGENNTPILNIGGGGGGSSVASGGGGGYPVFPQEPQNDNPQNPGEIYKDLHGAEWAREAVLYLTDKKIVSGDTNGYFRPNDNVTRAEFIKMLTIAFGASYGGNDTVFSDVKMSDWYYGAVMSAFDLRVVNGISADYFGAGENITRQDMAVMCGRMLEKYNITFVLNDEITSFGDTDITAEYARYYVNLLHKGGILNGTGEGNFQPMKATTRAESAKIIQTLLINCL